MFNFILICLCALSGVCTTIDTDALNALQKSVTFSTSTSANARTLKMQSLTNPFAAVTTTGKDNDEDHTHSITVYMKGFEIPSAQAKVQFTPAEDGYVCEVSVHYCRQCQLQKFKKFTLHTNSADFSAILPTKTKVNDKRSILTYCFPPCADEIDYSFQILTDFSTFPRFVFFGRKACSKECVDSAFSITQFSGSFSVQHAEESNEENMRLGGHSVSFSVDR